jgi:rhodanese-related sulfurtransferase
MVIKKGMSILPLALRLTLLGVLLYAAVVQAAAARMTKEELRAVLGSAEVVVVDVRSGQEWTASEAKILGAIRVNPAEVESLATRYPKDTTLVFYCA